jgi:hypothetical protein
MTDQHIPDELSYEEVHGAAPDELSFEQAHGVALPKSEAVPWGTWLQQQGADAAKSFGSGVVKGTAALPGIGGDVGDLIHAGAQYMGVDDYVPRPGLPTSQDTQKWTAEHVPYAREAIDYKPQTTTGKFAQTVGEFAPAVFVGGPAKNAAAFGREALAKLVPTVTERIVPTIARTSSLPTKAELATQVAAPAIASEGAGQATEGTWLEPAARVAGAVAGHGAASLAGGLAGTREGARSAVRNATGNVTAADLDAMDELMNAAKARGIDLTRAEALSHVTGGKTSLPDLQRVVEGEGALTPFFARRAGAIDKATGDVLDTLGPRSTEPELLGPATGKAARKEMRAAEGEVTELARPHYEKANPVKVAPKAIDESLAKINQLITKDTTGLTHPELERLSKQLANSNDIENLDRIRKNLRDRMALPTGSADALDKETYAKLNKALEPVTKAMDEASSDYVKGREVYQRAQREIVEPLRAGPLGRLAKKDPATAEVFNVLFPKKPVAGSEGAIGEAVSRLNGRNPHVARQLVRAYLDTEFSAARKAATGDAGIKFASAVAGHPQQAENLFAAVGALHGPEVTGGVRQFFDILHATGTRLQSGSKAAFDAGKLERLGQGNPLAEAVATLGTGIPRTLRDRFTRWAQGANTDELSKLLTDPRSAERFRALALAEPDSADWRSAIKGLITLAGREGRVIPQVEAHDPRTGRASGGSVGRMERAANRAHKALSLETRSIMDAPDEAVAAALRIAAER